MIRASRDILESGQPVTVASISRKAGVGRSTFYTHFSSTDEVIGALVDQMFDDLGMQDEAWRNDPSRLRSEITRIGLASLIEVIRSARTYLAGAAAGSAGAGTTRVRERLTEVMEASLRSTILAERPNADEGYLKTVAAFIAGGVLGTVLGWFEDPRGRTEPQIIETLYEMLPDWLTEG